MSLKEYDIKTVQDFLKVPEDRIADCLAEFKEGLDIARPFIEISEMLGTDNIFPQFTWIDDGEKNKTIHVELEKTE